MRVFWIVLVVALQVAWTCLAWAHGDVHDQIVALTRRIEQRTNDAALYLARGELHRVHRDWKAAAADYDRAAQLDPGLLQVDFCRGRLALDADDPAGAERALDRFLAQSPKHTEALACRARARVKQGKALAAVKDFDAAIRFAEQPKPEWFLERAEGYLAAGTNHTEAALRSLDEGIRRLGPLVTLELPAVDMEVRLGRFDAALGRLERMSARSPRKETWLVRRAEVLHKAGRMAEARASYESALQAIAKLNPSQRATRAMAELKAKAEQGLAKVAE